MNCNDFADPQTFHVAPTQLKPIVWLKVGYPVPSRRKRAFRLIKIHSLSAFSSGWNSVTTVKKLKGFSYSVCCSCCCTHWARLCWYHHHLANKASLAPRCLRACQDIITITLWLVTALFVTDVKLLTKAPKTPSSKPATYPTHLWSSNV